MKVAGDDGGPAWADAGVICPWTIYQVYGDRRLLERLYPSMLKFVEFCRKRSTPELLPSARYHCFGDWLSIGADTPKDGLFRFLVRASRDLWAFLLGEGRFPRHSHLSPEDPRESHLRSRSWTLRTA